MFPKVKDVNNKKFYLQEKGTFIAKNDVFEV